MWEVLVKEQYKNAKVGDYLIFGQYEQNNYPSDRPEEIEWLVLAKKGKQTLLISRYALDNRKYNTSSETTWADCSLRKWLNESFVNDAFTTAEQNRIVNTGIKADSNPSYKTSPGKDTTDKVFLLSITEVKEYFGELSSRQCQGTKYCYAQGASKGKDGNCKWRLRTPGYNSSHVASVLPDGTINNDGDSVDSNTCAVRPAMWVMLEP